jgi:hypothetical protein
MIYWCMFEAVKKFLTILTVLCCTCSFAQYTAIKINAPSLTDSSTSVFKHNKTRIYLAAAGSVAGYTGSLVALSNAWYKQYPQTPFHFFNDTNDWLQVDKAGHVFSAYNAGKWSMELWRWAGLSRKERVWIGGLSGTVFLTAVEVLDGFSSGWGFSIGDLSADLVGSGLFIAQELAWNEQRIQVKFSFHHSTYEDPVLDKRANDLFGNHTLERMLKDYNSQTYWASANLTSFLKKANLPSWLNIAIGFGADGMFGGTENIVRDKNGIILFNRSDIPRYRQWYLAPDIDLTRIKTKSKFLKTTFFLLNSLKFPTPSIGFSKKGIEWNWLHF